MRKRNFAIAGLCGLYVTGLAVAPFFVSHNWASATSGNWSDSARWNPSGVPNGAGNSATIAATGGAYTVTLNQNLTDIDSVTLDSPDATLVSSGRVVSSPNISFTQGLARILNSSTWTGSTSFNNAGNLEVLNSTLNGPFANSGTLTAIASGQNNTSVFNNGLSNSGTLNLSTAGGAYLLTLSVNGGTLSNSAAGTISLQQGAGGTRNLDAQLLNAGQMVVDGFTRLGRAGVAHANTGTINIQANRSLVLDQASSSFDMQGGTLNVNGAFTVSAGTLVFSGGTINGRPQLYNSSLVFPSGTTGAGEVGMVANSSLAGGPNANQSVFIRADGQNTTVTLTGPITNAGLLDFASIGGGYATNLVLSSGQITNTGVIRTLVGNGGLRYLSADIVNNGTLQFDGSTSFVRLNGFYTNNQNFNVTGSTVISGNTQTFNQNGGQFSVSGSFAMEGNTFNFNGGAITGNDPVLNNSALNIAGAGSGTVTMTGNGSIAGTIGSAKGVRIHGNGQNTAISAPTGLVNNGNLSLFSSGGGYSASLNSASGVIVNNGTMSVLAGSGGPKTIGGDFTNTGTLNVDLATVFSKSGGIYNNTGGTINLAANLSYNGLSQVFNMNSGLITGGDFLSATNATFNLNGGTINGTASINTSTLNIAGSGTGTAAFFMRGSSTLTGDVKAPQTLRIEANGANATMTSPVSYQNAGNIFMTSVGGGYASTLNLTAGTLSNTGTITVSPGAGGPRTIGANLNNSGMISINQPTTLAKANGVHTHSGSLAIASPFTINSNSQVFTQTGGTVTGGDLFAINSAGYVFNGGTISGKPRITTGSLDIGPTSTGVGQFFLSGVSTLAGNIKPNQTVHVNGNGANAALTSAGAYTNQGTMILDSSGGGYSASHTVSSGALTNAGMFQVLPGAGGPRTVTFDLTNQGSFDVSQPLSLNKVNGLYINSGSFNANASAAIGGGTPTFRQVGGTLAASTNFTLINGIFEFLGGTITGTPFLRSCQLSVGPSASIPATLITTGSSSLVSNLIFGNDVVVQGNGTDGTGTLTSATGFSNAGTIRLESAGGGYSSQFVITSGTFLQQPSGRLVFNSGAGGPRNATCTLNNNGLVEFNIAGTIGRSGAAHSNGGTFRVTGNNTATVIGSSFNVTGSGRVEGVGTVIVSGFSNGGTVAPGLPAGKLTLGGTHMQTANGVVAVDLGGTSQGTNYDWYAVTGTASLNGKLQVRLINSFDPPNGTEFTVMTASAITGAFSGLDLVDFPLNKSAEIVYTANSVKVRIKDGSLVGPDSYIVTVGEELTGGLTSLSSSDNNRLNMLPDAFSLVTQVEITGTAPNPNPVSMRVTLEASVARNSMSQVLEAFNYVTNSWAVLSGVVGSGTDTTVSPTIGVNAANFVGPANIVKARVTWAPINDEDPAQDGWLHSIDVLSWTLAYP